MGQSILSHTFKSCLLARPIQAVEQGMLQRTPTKLLFLIFFSRGSRNKNIKQMTKKILVAIMKPKEVLVIMSRW